MLRSPDEALRLAEDVRAEIEAIARVVADAEQILARSGPGEPERMLVYAAGAVLHSFYTGVEKAFLHLAPALNGGAPRDPAWHRRLLEQMSRPLAGVRPAVVS